MHAHLTEEVIFTKFILQILAQKKKQFQSVTEIY